jgi:hypothetical protein
MTWLSFADSAPRAYWLKAGNAYFTSSTSAGTCPQQQKRTYNELRKPDVFTY